MGGVGGGAEMWGTDRPLFFMSNFLIVPNLIKKTGNGCIIKESQKLTSNWTNISQ